MTRLETRPNAISLHRPSTLQAFVTVLGAALALAAGSLTAEPSLVSRLTVVNPTVYRVEVQVRGEATGAVMDLGAVRPELSRNIEEIVEQGDSWAFRFSYGGEPAGDLVVSRAELERSGWRITIPERVGAHLQQAGFPPSAR